VNKLRHWEQKIPEGTEILIKDPELYNQGVDWKHGYLSSITIKNIEALEDWEFREMRDWLIGILQTRFHKAYHALEAEDTGCKARRSEEKDKEP